MTALEKFNAYLHTIPSREFPKLMKMAARHPDREAGKTVFAGLVKEAKRRGIYDEVKELALLQNPAGHLYAIVQISASGVEKVKGYAKSIPEGRGKMDRLLPTTPRDSVLQLRKKSPMSGRWGHVTTYQANPALPRGKWVSGQVRVDSKGKVMFRKGAQR